MRILVAGSTGYVGGRLVARLLAEGHEVRCLARTPSKLSLRPWRNRVEIVRGDALDPGSLIEATAGCDAAYYLIRSTAADKGHAAVDREAAANFSAAVDEAGLGRVIYLGALAREPQHSSHALSRHEVGRVLASGSTPVVEIRSAPIIGSGSLTFEMVRHLTEALPVAVVPRWVYAPCQPVAIADVLDTLVAALDGDARSRMVELGGPETLTYRRLMRTYAREAGLRRRAVIPAPARFPRSSSWWIGLVTPLPPNVARRMVADLRALPVVATDDPAADDVVIGRTSCRAAIDRALSRLPAGAITRWTDADTGSVAAGPEWEGALFMDRQVVPTHTDDGHLFWAFSRIGGRNGYYGLDWAWRLRGLLDQLIGGVGLRRGRRHPTEVRHGDAVDFWRVEEVIPGMSMRLRAELRVPGDSWIEWETRRTEHGSDLVQTSWFRPRGVLGHLYWYLMLPGHRLVFPRMARRIAAAAEERAFSSW
jgi:uncharacterized protein YbjT (DUF2867 family)